MPREARVKVSGADAVYHICNRAGGNSGDLPFGDAEKEEFVRILRKLSRYYCAQLLSFSMMGNHYHILVCMPGEAPSKTETAARYAQYYDNKRWLDPDSDYCKEIASRLRDVSWFAHDLQQKFTTWFNHSEGRNRRGSVWAGRFKSCLFECGTSVAWECLKYIEMNAVRAGIVDDAAEYRFSSWGVWTATGKHPDEEALLNYLAPRLADRVKIKTAADLKLYLGTELARVTASEAGVVGSDLDTVIARAKGGMPFHRQLTHRCRYWLDGAVIGSKSFIRQVVTQNWGEERAERRFKPLDDPAADEKVYSYRYLRKAD